MKNKEKYAKEIMDIACSGNRIAVIKEKGYIVPCSCVLCSVCSFCGSIDCRKNIKDWLESEYIEKLVISKRDRMFLDYIDKKFNYIVRTSTGDIRLFAVKPRKGQYEWRSDYPSFTSLLDSLNIDLPMIKWSDDKPWLIEDLKKLEVVEEYEI